MIGRLHLHGAGPVIALMFFTLVLLAIALYVIGESEAFATLRAAVALPLLLMLGLGTLLMLLTAMVAVLQGFGLADRRRAFGLPDGSMQAVIALSLVLIFVIASLYLYSSLPTGYDDGDEEAFRQRFDFAKQLLTTVGTLAVAVAGFYFGARSVEAAATTTAPRGGRLRIVEPRSPAELDQAAGTSLTIRAETTPGGLRTNAFIVRGDDEGTITRLPSGEFQYVRGSAAEAVVTIALQLEDGSERQELEVRAPQQ